MNRRRSVPNHRNNATQTEGYHIFYLPLVLIASTISLYLLTLGITLDESKGFTLKFPTSIEDISVMTTFLKHTREQNPSYTMLLFSCAYVYKQTFAVPGSVFLNLLAGALYGPIIGFALASILTAIGATNCYLLSRTFGKSYVLRRFPDRVESFHRKIEENRDSLFFFLLFLRIFPMSPNWFMNIVAPLVGIPINLFFLSVLIGLMPYNFVCVQTGSVMSQISSIEDIFTYSTLAKMSLVAVIALVPGLIIKQLHKNRQR